MNSTHDTRILKFNTQMLKFFLIWPSDLLSKKQSYYFLRGCFVFWLICSAPLYSAVIFQLYMGIDSVQILLEALVGFFDNFGYTIVYLLFLNGHDRITALIDDYKQFIQYSGIKMIRKTDEKIAKLTKYLSGYCLAGFLVIHLKQILSTKSCLSRRGSVYYAQHDPCWLPGRFWFPFDPNQPKFVWFILPLEALYITHVCLFFGLATTTVTGFLMHITTQLQCCSKKFKLIFNEVHLKSNQQIKEDYLFLIKYYTKILNFSNKVFTVFNTLIIVYVTVASFVITVASYQVIKNKESHQRLTYFILLFGLTSMVFILCYNSQKVQDEAFKLGQSIFHSNWQQNGISVQLQPYILFTLARTQIPLQFKDTFLGPVTLNKFMMILRWSYSGVTLLLTISNDK